MRYLKISETIIFTKLYSIIYISFKNILLKSRIIDSKQNL